MSLSTGVALAAHVHQARNLPKEWITKMLEKAALHVRYQQNKTTRKMPPTEALASALEYLYVGAYTGDGAGNPYAYLATEENVKFVEACISGVKVMPGGSDARVPDYATVKTMLPEMDPPDITKMLMLEQRGHNHEESPRAHVVKLLMDAIQRSIGRAAAKKAPKASAEDLEDLNKA